MCKFGKAMSSSRYLIFTYSCYIFPNRISPDIGALLRFENRLALGDFNAYRDLWHSCLSNDRMGMEIMEQIDESTVCTMNDEAPIRITCTCNIIATQRKPSVYNYFERETSRLSVDNWTFVNFKKLNGSASQN